MGLHHDRTAVARDHGESTRAATMSPARSARGLLAAAGVAGALTLSGCGLLPFGQTTEGTDGAGEATAQPSTAPETATPEPPTTETGTDGTDGAGGTDSADSSTGSGEDEEDWISTESLAGDSSVELDEDGSGRFPQAALEVDIKDLFVNKYDVDVDEVDCLDDVVMITGHGSTACDVITPDRTYYGTVVIDQDEGELFKYELQFPGLDKDALDLD